MPIPQEQFRMDPYILYVNLTNPASSASSPYPCYIQFVLTEEDRNTASPNDVAIALFTQAPNQIPIPPFTYPDFTTKLTPTLNGNTLTFLCAPSGSNWVRGIEGLSSNGFTMISGFKETLTVEINLNISGQFSLGISVVPAT
jgi:hypothetical protein